MHFFRVAVLGLALGLIVVPVSELLFWPVVPVSIPGLVLFYAACALLGALLFERSGARGWAGYALAGGIMGWLVEGVVVNQTYEAVPFSLVWTPLAWHMLLSVMGGVVAMGWALRRGFAASLLVCGVLGLLAGLWGGYGWTALAEDVATPETGLSFVAAVGLSSLMMAAGHLLLAYLPGSIVPRRMLWGLLGLAGFFWVAGWGWIHFPVSVAVPVLIGVSLLALRRAGPGAHPIAPDRFPLWRLGTFLAVPALAIPVQAMVIEAPSVAEMNAFFAAPASLIGAIVWIAALAVCFARKPG